MTKRYRGKFRGPQTPLKTPHKKRAEIHHLLEQGTLGGIREAKKLTNALIKFYWDEYSEFAGQRSLIQDKLTESLLYACRSNFSFKSYQRAVRWKYGLHPLSTVGSVTGIGGRFNIGCDLGSAVPTFPALYLAIDKDTALQETLGVIPTKDCDLSAQEIALTNPQSEVLVSVSGELEKVFDLRSSVSLENFTELIKDFRVSNALLKSAQDLGVKKPQVVRTPEKLLGSLLEENWRLRPMQYDVPANPQIFGQLIYHARIEGILYLSKYTGKECLAIYPHNFADSSSHIVFDDERPHEKIPSRIDSSNWRQCDLSPRELLEGVTT